MYSKLNFLILLHLSPLCHSAPGIFDDPDIFASSYFPQPDTGVDNLLSFAPSDDNYDFDLQSYDGLNLGGMDLDSYSDPDSSMFQALDGTSQSYQEADPSQEILANGASECSSDDIFPSKRLRARENSCKPKQDLDLKLPTLNNLPQKKLPSPAPLNPPSWQPDERYGLYNMPEIENHETCPMSFRGWYYVPVCGVRLGDQGRYTPTALNQLRGWTVTDATICESTFNKIQTRILVRWAKNNSWA